MESHNATIIGEISSIIHQTTTIFNLQQTQSQGLAYLQFQIISIQLNNAQGEVIHEVAIAGRCDSAVGMS